MERFSMKKALKYDGIMFSALMTLFVSIVITVILYFYGDENREIINYIFLAVIGLSLVLFTYRFIVLASFNNAELDLVKAEVVSSWYYRGSKRITFSYIYQNQQFKALNIVLNKSATRDIRKGDEISVFIKVNSPKKALIRELYFTDNEL
jgi:hypothetical protein